MPPDRLAGAAETMSTIETHILDCGMPLVVESVDGVQSAALTWMLPVGAATDPDDADGLASMLSELIFRGAGDRNSREHSDALDLLGVRRSATVGTHHLRLTASMVAARLDDAVPLLVDMIRRPRFAEDALDPVRSLCLQSLESLEDEPQHLVMLRLRERHLSPPFNRTGYGRAEVIQGTTITALRDSWNRRAVPRGSILAVAGAVDAPRLVGRMSELLNGWIGSAHNPVAFAEPERGMLHIEQETAQVHLGMSWDAPPERDETSMLERIGNAVLSGSTSGRLFTEVRQKRSLCYSVGASYRAGRDTGRVALYAGTTPQRAQETLDVCHQEVTRLRDGAERDEFDRAVIGLKSSIIMQGESVPSRAGALAYDQFRLGRARSLEEVTAQVDAVTIDALNNYLASRELGDITIASIGPQPLTAPQPMVATA